MSVLEARAQGNGQSQSRLTSFVNNPLLAVNISSQCSQVAKLFLLCQFLRNSPVVGYCIVLLFS